MGEHGHFEEMKSQERMHVWVHSIPDDILMHFVLKSVSVSRHRKGRQVFSATLGSENGIKISTVSRPCTQHVADMRQAFGPPAHAIAIVSSCTNVCTQTGQAEVNRWSERHARVPGGTKGSGTTITPVHLDLSWLIAVLHNLISVRSGSCRRKC